MPLQVLLIRFDPDVKQLKHERTEAYYFSTFERVEVLDTALPHFRYLRILSEFSKPLIDAFHRSHSRCASIAANLPRQINQRNDNGKRTDDLADCTNRFPIHGIIHVIAPAIQSHCTIRRKDF